MSGGRGYEGGRTRMVSSGVMRYLVGDGLCVECCMKILLTCFFHFIILHSKKSCVGHCCAVKCV